MVLRGVLRSNMTDSNSATTAAAGSAEPAPTGAAALPPTPVDPTGTTAAASAAAPKDAASQSINMRCLIVTQDASIIIGKSGKHVNEIRVGILS